MITSTYVITVMRMVTGACAPLRSCINSSLPGLEMFFILNRVKLMSGVRGLSGSIATFVELQSIRVAISVRSCNPMIFSAGELT